MRWGVGAISPLPSINPRLCRVLGAGGAGRGSGGRSISLLTSLFRPVILFPGPVIRFRLTRHVTQGGTCPERGGTSPPGYYCLLNPQSEEGPGRMAAGGWRLGKLELQSRMRSSYIVGYSQATRRPQGATERQGVVASYWALHTAHLRGNLG